MATEGLSERFEVLHSAVDAELTRGVGVGLAAYALELLVSGFAPALCKAGKEALAGRVPAEAAVPGGCRFLPQYV